MESLMVKRHTIKDMLVKYYYLSIPRLKLELQYRYIGKSRSSNYACLLSHPSFAITAAVFGSVTT